MAIEAVVFDWGGVLAGSTSTGFAELERMLGLPAGSAPELLGLHPCATDSENVWHRRELGAATAHEWARWYADRVAAVGGPAIPVETLVESQRDWFTIEPNTAVIDAVQRLKADGYRLGICTNNFSEAGTAWREKLPIELFDVVAVSCEIGVRKPDPAMYTYVTDQLGTQPHATVLLDDLAGNVAGARAVGWHAILVGSDHAAAIAELHALLS
jgi:epoxide hydrolase-like predicted phosphatase